MIDFAAWLKSAAVRVVLVEVQVAVAGGGEVTRYLASRPFTSKSTDSLANQYYQPVLTAGVNYTEQLDIEGTGSMSVGDIEISNFDGSRDSWLDDVWDNRSIRAYVGDPSWARADFQLVFDGVVATIGCKSRDTLNISIRDKTQRLNTPITDKKVGVASTNSDDVYSLSFGEVSNVTPVLLNTATLKYAVHDGPIEDVIEVRDNGKPVPVTTDLTTGTFTLQRPSAGAITASVKGDKNVTYKTTIAGIIRRLVQGYGLAANRFQDSEIDIQGFTDFDTAHPQLVGIYADGRTNVLEACNMLASSLDARLVASRLGQLRLIQLVQGGTGTPIVVDSSMMIERSLRITDRPLVKGAIKLGFDKNWTVQQDLVTAIPDQHKKLFADEWLTTTASDATVVSKYYLNNEPVQEDTMLGVVADANAEAARRLALWSVQRTVYQFEGTPELLLTAQLGGALTLKHSRYGLSAGKTGIIVSLTPNWYTGRVTVGVLI